MAAVVLFGSIAMYSPATVSELPVYVDPIMEVSIEDEETPLAAKPKVTTKKTTKTKTSKKNVKIKKAAKKTYTKKLKTTKKTSTKTSKKNSSTATTTVKKKTTVTTARTEKYKKKSKKKLVTTKVTTTVVTTTTVTPKATTKKTTKTSTASRPVATSVSNTTTATKGKYEISIDKVAPKMTSKVRDAYKKMGWEVIVDSTVSYAGYCDANTGNITLKKEDDTIYHELGHFIAFVAGNVDKKTDFINVYKAEKDKFTGTNEAYATQSASEYFAESVKDYVIRPAVLMKERPKTYVAVVNALNKITDAQVNAYIKLYGSLWK